jgi:ADP-dependent phosphofructokinase/glucokinase
VLVRKAWDDRLRAVAKSTTIANARVLTAYNAVIDHVESVNVESIQQLVTATGRDSEILLRSSFEPKAVRTPEEFLAALLHSFREGRALHIVTESESLLDWLNHAFKGQERKQMGGQAGIIANHLSSLGASVTTYTPLLSAKQAQVFQRNVKIATMQKGKLALLSPSQAARKLDKTKINWIFEYKHGDRITIAGQHLVAPRANRFILATDAPVLYQFDKEITKQLPNLGQKFDKAIFSGYSYLDNVWQGVKAQDYIAQEVKNLRALRSKNKQMRIHAEFVPSKNPALEKKAWSALTQEIKSIGCNEVELQKLLEHFKFQKEQKSIEKIESALTIYKGAKKLMGALKLDRIHVHNLGYFVIVLSKDYPVELEKVRDAALYASAVAQARALSGETVGKNDVAKGAEVPVSETGLNQVRIIAGELAHELPKGAFDQKRFTFEGVWRFKDHSLIVVPGQIIVRPKTTVGLGDVISSVSFVAEG